MREIKFRAWDKRNQEMTDFSSMPFYITDIEVSWDKFDFMQYTGLNVNGKEIYEGDIYAYHIKVSSIQGVDFYFERTSVVEFKDGAFWVGDYLLSEALEGDKNPKIIGNIYENPELLEQHHD